MSDQSWARVLQCDWSNWIGPGVGHGRDTTILTILNDHHYKTTNRSMIYIYKNFDDEMDSSWLSIDHLVSSNYMSTTSCYIWTTNLLSIRFGGS